MPPKGSKRGNGAKKGALQVGPQRVPQPEAPEAAGHEPGGEVFSTVLWIVCCAGSMASEDSCPRLQCGHLGQNNVCDDMLYQEPQAKRRRQLGRRDSEEAVNRAMQKHFAHLPQEVVETHRIDGVLVRDIIRRDRNQLPPGGRLGSAYWVQLAGQISRACAGLDCLRPETKDPSIASMMK